jgi:colanic acid/amylovoran biosynthesis glycosyltransferase
MTAAGGALMGPAGAVPMPAPDTRKAVAHLVTPYLFSTGSWIHGQLLNNPRYRAVVMTQKTENLDVFPFEPVYDLSRRRAGVPGSGLVFEFSKYVLGRFPAAPYLEAARMQKVVLFHAHLGWEAARTIHLRRRLGVPFVTSFYGRDATMIPRKIRWKVLYKRLLAEGDLFIAEGGRMARTLEEIGAPREKIRVVHLGTDLDRIPFAERRPRPDGKATGLIAASFRPKKGIPYALEALARVAPRYPGLRLRVIGDGPMRAQIEARAARSDLSGRIDLLGYLPFPKYLKELRAADFMMAPSVTAPDGDTEGGAPVCLLDGQAAGLPIIASEHCDIPEVTLPGVSAFLSPERDVDSLARNLEALLSMPERWAEMGRAGRAHVEAEFDLRRQGERMADVYDEVLALGRASG